jgi:hypothetical protein
MQVTLLPAGRLRVQDPSGAAYEIGPEHPDFPRLRSQCAQPAGRSSLPLRLFGLLFIVMSVAGWWYNRHLAETSGYFYIKLCILGPLGVFGGLLMAARPDWSGPWRADSPRGHKIALISLIGLMAILSGFEFFHLKGATTRTASYTRWTPAMGTPAGMETPAPRPRVPAAPAMPVKFGATDMTFLGQTYHLASYNQKSNPMWEFVPPADNINDWKTLLTVIDRPDARTRPELDRLAEGIMASYKSRGAQILLAKTMQTRTGEVFNYLVAAFEEPQQQRYELNFAKMVLGPANAEVMIYGVRINDPRDYRTKAKEFLNQHSSEVGKALEEAPLPDVSSLPRRVF